MAGHPPAPQAIVINPWMEGPHRGAMANSLTPRLAGIATAVPSYVLDQAAVARAGLGLFQGTLADGGRAAAVYANAAIGTRYSCVPLEWYLAPHSFAERNDLYLRHAVELAEQAIRSALVRAGLAFGDVDAIVAVSTSGIATPSLDALLVERLSLRRDIERLPIFGLGCAGGVLGLARSGALARARPGARVLLVVVELCGLTFRHGDRSKSNLIASALFGDGAVACVVSTAGAGLGLVAWGEHTWPDSLNVMGWHVGNDGLGVVFSRDIPALVRRDFATVTDDFLARHGLTRARIDQFICHPGGAKVVDALEEALGVPAGALEDSRSVLRDYGNMSAATVLFVLERALGAGRQGRYLLSALGPGFTAGFLLAEVA